MLQLTKRRLDAVAEYEMVREIQNMCPNNQMRDVFFEEVQTDDPAAYVREMLMGRAVQVNAQEGSNGVITVFADCSGMIQKFIFTPI
jgi:hypothetical protein